MDQFGLFSVPELRPNSVAPSVELSDPGPVAEALSHAEMDRQLVQLSKAVLAAAAPERIAGRCVREVQYGSGRTAVDVGPVEVIRTESMDIVFQNGSQRFCFFRDSVRRLEEFIEVAL